MELNLLLICFFYEGFRRKGGTKYHLKRGFGRYVDDIFLIREHGEEQLEEFIQYLNSLNTAIKFTNKISRDSIEFLDVLVIKEQNLQTFFFFVKETGTHQFLHFSCCHPFHAKKEIPFSHALRLRRICSKDEFFKNRGSNLKESVTVGV